MGDKSAFRNAPRDAFWKARLAADFGSSNQLEKTSLQQRFELHAEYLNQNDRSGKEKHPFPVGKLCDGLLPDVLIFHDALQVQGIHNQMNLGSVSTSVGQTS